VLEACSVVSRNIGVESDWRNVAQRWNERNHLIGNAIEAVADEVRVEYQRLEDET
jgi:hypothetical protein